MVEFIDEAIWAWAFLCSSFLVISVSSFVIGLFILSISSWVSFSSLCLSENLFISSKLSNLLVYNCSEYCFIILFTSVRSVAISPHSFLILVF